MTFVPEICRVESVMAFVDIKISDPFITAYQFPEISMKPSRWLTELDYNVFIDFWTPSKALSYLKRPMSNWV